MLAASSAGRGTAAACVTEADVLLRNIGVDLHAGLSHADAARRAKEHGANELRAKEEEPMWRRFVDKLKEPMIILLLASAALSIITGQYDDAISITLAVLIVTTVAVVQEHKSDQSIAALSMLAPPSAHVRREGRLLDVAAAALVPGDIIVIAAGDRVPADVRLVDVADLSVDESSLTGENEPASKTGAALSASAAGPAGVPVAERRNCAFMGTLVSSGRAIALVVETGMGTELGCIMASMEEAEERPSPLQAKMDALSKRLATISFVIIGAISLIGLLEHKPWLEMLTIGVSLAVAAIPEGLPIVVTVTLALGVQRMAAKRAVVKRLPAVEALGCTTVLAMDKTGTLTRNEQTVVEAFTLATPLGWQNTPSAAAATDAAAFAASGGAMASGGSSGASTTSRGSITALPPLAGAGSAVWRDAASDPTVAHHLLHDSVLGRGGLVGGARVLFSGLGYSPIGGGAVYSRPPPTAGAGSEAATAGSSSAGKAASGKAGAGSAPITAVTDQHMALLLEAAAVCNNADVRLTATGSARARARSSSSSGDNSGNSSGGSADESVIAELAGQPTEGALLVAAAKVPLLAPSAPSSSASSTSMQSGGFSSARRPHVASSVGGLAAARHWYVRTGEIPFSSDAKWMAVRARYVPGAATASAAAAARGEDEVAAVTATAAAAAAAASSSSSAALSAAAAGAGIEGDVGGSGSSTSASSPARTAAASAGAVAAGETVFVKGAVEAVLALCDHAVGPAGHPAAVPSLAEAVRGDALRGLLSVAAGISSGGASASAAAAAAPSFAVVPLDAPSRAAVLAAAETMAREGLRVLALAKGDRMPAAPPKQTGSSGSSVTGSGSSTESSAGGVSVVVSGGAGMSSGGSATAFASGAGSGSGASSGSGSGSGLVFLGLLGLHDPPREGVLDTLAALATAGVRTCMITGDGMSTALSIAAHLGLLKEHGRGSGLLSGSGSGYGSGYAGAGSSSSSSPSASGVELPVALRVASGSGGAPNLTSPASAALAAGLGVLRPGSDAGAAHEVDVEQLAGLGGAGAMGSGPGFATAASSGGGTAAGGRVALSGSEIDALSQAELSAMLRGEGIRVFYRTTPQHKMKLIHAFQACGHVVAMTGDGINDSIALKVADIGVAMGGRGATDVAREAADVVLLDDNLRTLLPAIEEGKGIFYNIRNFVRFQLSTSVAALLLVAIATTLQLPPPLNAMQILWINIIMDGPPAQSLGVEPVAGDVLKQPPRPASEEILTWRLMRRVIVAAVTVVVGTLLVMRSELQAAAALGITLGAGASSAAAAAAAGPLAVATAGSAAAATTSAAGAAASAVVSAAHTLAHKHLTTMTFTTFVMFDMFNAYSCRSLELSVRRLSFSGNTVFLWAIGGSIAGQLAVIYLPPLQAVFQTVALSADDWLRILVTASTVLLVDEAMKAVEGAGGFGRVTGLGSSGGVAGRGRGSGGRWGEFHAQTL